MSDFLPQLLFLAVGGAIAPPLLLLTILFLGSRRPLPNATALALGYFATCAAIGIAGLTLFAGAAGAGSAASTAGLVISASVGGLLVVLGLRSLLNAPDPDAQPPRWMESISSISPPRAFGVGMALFPLQIKNLAIFLACINLIAVASLSPRSNAVALGLVLVVFAIPVLVLIGLYAAVPQRASAVSTTCGRGWRRTTARSRSFCASCSERTSSSEASGDREIMSNSRRPVMGALTKDIPKSVALVALLITACLSLLSPHVYGKEARQGTSLSNLLGPGRCHIPGADGG
jgi:hypothetical protein